MAKKMSMPALPKLPKVKYVVDCACGCGAKTQSTWYTGHDGRAYGWALRIHRGAMKLEDVPANERKGAMRMAARVARDEAANEQAEAVNS